MSRVSRIGSGKKKPVKRKADGESTKRDLTCPPLLHMSAEWPSRRPSAYENLKLVDGL
jgi:hypothetical protein